MARGHTPYAALRKMYVFEIFLYYKYKSECTLETFQGYKD